MRRLENFIFDLDGTLVDSLPGIEFSAQAALSQVTTQLSITNFRPYIGPPIREIFRRALKLENDSDLLDGLERAFRVSYDDQGWTRTNLYPGVKKILMTLSTAGQRCYVLTNKPKHAVEKILQYLEVRPYFTAVYAPDMIHPPYASKSEMALALLQEERLDPATTCIVGDSLDDAAAAQHCGLHFIAIDFGYGDACRQNQYPMLQKIYQPSQLALLGSQTV
jgi:phosphoglycolate phosphatase